MQGKYGFRAEAALTRALLVLSSRGACDDPDRLGGLAADPQLVDDPVAVAPIGRARELDDLAVGRARDPLEQKRRRVERHPERLRLLLVGDGRLDGLLPADDLDPVPAGQELVEGILLEISR